ncbi:hypothetical protein RI367_003318 [Sorochytrium milnesiophthora]
MDASDRRSFYSGVSSLDVTRMAKDNSVYNKGDVKNPLDEISALRRSLMAEEDLRPNVVRRLDVTYIPGYLRLTATLGGKMGVLAVRIKEAHFIAVKDTTRAHENTYCTVSIRNFCKKTHVRAKQNDRIDWDQTKHFPVVVPQSRKHPFNLVRIQLFEFDSFNPNAHRELGGVSFHLHDIVSVSPIMGAFDVWDQHQLIGDIEVEITFSYGSFGYGYSSQLKEERRTPEEMVAYSLFPRIVPPKEQQEAERGVMAVKALQHPSFIPFKEKAFLSYGKELGQLAVAPRDTFAPEMAAADINEIEAMRDRYFGMSDRVARIMFLHNYLFCASTKPEITSNCGLEVGSKDLGGRRDVHQKSYIPFVQPFNTPITTSEDEFLRAAQVRRAKTQTLLDKARGAGAGLGDGLAQQQQSRLQTTVEENEEEADAS